MKRILALVLAAVLLLTATACGGPKYAGDFEKAQTAFAEEDYVTAYGETKAFLKKVPHSSPAQELLPQAAFGLIYAKQPKITLDGAAITYDRTKISVQRELQQSSGYAVSGYEVDLNDITIYLVRLENSQIAEEMPIVIPVADYSPDDACNIIVKFAGETFQANLLPLVETSFVDPFNDLMKKLRKKTKVTGEDLGIVNWSASRQAEYDTAAQTLKDGNYQEAAQLFMALGYYQDSREQYCEARYQIGLGALQENSYDEAIGIFEEINGYSDSAQQLQTAKDLRYGPDYQKAQALYQQGDYIAAFDLWLSLDGYSDSVALALKTLEKLMPEVPAVDLGRSHLVALSKDGKVYASGRRSEGQLNVSAWPKNLVAVSAGSNHTAGLRPDGTVIAVGNDKYGQLSVDEWEHIIMLEAGNAFTLGLKVDGTVVAAGNNGYGALDVQEWTDITAISAGSFHSLGLKKDGTVVAAGSKSFGQTAVEGWTDIVAISAGSCHSVGLKADGTVVAAGTTGDRTNTRSTQCNVGDWKDIVAIAAGEYHTVGLKSDGTVVGIGSGCNPKALAEWTDIVAISAGGGCTVGLKSDGSLVFDYYNASNRAHPYPEATSWTDVQLP